jgi:WD40 repeat protein
MLELQAPITALASSASGTFVSVQKTGEIDIWDFTTYKHLKSFKDPVGNLISVDITDDGSRIVTGSSNGIVRFWDVNTGISISQPSNYPEKINSVHWLPSGQAALSGSFDQTLRIWDAATGRNISTWLGHWKGVGDIALSKNSDLAVVGAAYYNDAINVWNLSQDYISRKLCAAGNTEDFAACKNFENL